MARPIKTGIDYFPFDVDFFDDDKIMLIESEFGMKGGYIAVRLLCKIYKEGYYYKWGTDECLLFARALGADAVSKGLIDEVIQCMVRRGFFDKKLFEQYKILTSYGIQKRYFEATKRYKKIDVFSEYLLIVDTNSINANINSINVNTNATKKSRVKEKENIYTQIFLNSEERLVFKTLEPLLNEILEDQACIEDLQISAGAPYPTSEEIKEKVKEFFVKLTVDGEQIKERKSAIYHFKSWVNREQDKKEIKENKANLGVGEYIQDGKRYYGSRKYEVPMDMPPRPTKDHYLDLINKRWLR